MNELKNIFNSAKVKPYRLADAIGMSRSHIYKLLNGQIPTGTKIETLEKIANTLGYKVVIGFVTVEENCPDCGSLSTDLIGGLNVHCEDCGTHFSASA